ncbi:MAG: NERD domain-containing protein [Mycoplasmataceae bacterium]|nr:NERD domain-containing protein [Mycoplasmataceae bacterium]
MDFEKVKYIIGISISMLFILALLIFFFVRFLNKRMPKESYTDKLGREAENKINKIIKSWADRNNAHYISSSMFKYDKNKIFEVDGILITARALIIVEIKNINGVIEGKGLEKTWFKILGTKRHEIRNPIIQNEKHIEHILAITKLKVPMLSLIVFDNRTEALNCSDVPPHVIVIKVNDLETSLNEINDQLMPKINMAEIQQIYYSLSEHVTSEPEDYKMLLSFGKEKDNNDFTI